MSTPTLTAQTPPAPLPDHSVILAQSAELISLLKTAQRQWSEGEPKEELHVKWFEVFLPATIGIATLGSSITFASIVSPMEDPIHLTPNNADALTNALFTREAVREFIGISWLLFRIALGISSFAALLLNFNRASVKKGFATDDSRYTILGAFLLILLEGLILGAFSFLSLALVAYSEKVGWAAVASSVTTFVLIFLGIWVPRFCK